MNKLFIVGTPIGNMKDITLRALETLKEVKIIACEDTRVTQKLLNYHKINDKRLIAYHDRNESSSSKGIIDLINSGNDVVVVSDAGMPVINDPGFEVIREAINENIQIEIIPGVSSITTVATISNLDSHFKFLGFLKPKTGQRKNQLKTLTRGSYIYLASPHRLLDELNDILEVIGDIKIYIGRELTKKFETHYRGIVSEVIEQVKDEIKGEFTICFEIPKKVKENKYGK